MSGRPIPSTTGLSKEVAAVIGPIKEQIEVWSGSRGDELSRAVTFRDLVNGGLATYIDGKGQRIRANKPSGSIAPTNEGSAYYDIPPGANSLKATGSIGVIHLTWKAPSYPYIAGYNVYRASADNPGLAVKRSFVTSELYSDEIGSFAGYYYWVRTVSEAGKEGPFNAVKGTYGETGVDPAYILQIVQDQIEESSLTAALRTRINSIETTANTAYGYGADIIAEQIARANADSALASDIVVLYAGVSSANSAITSEATTRASADSALASDITTLYSQTASNSSAITSEATTRATADSALASDITTLYSQTSSNSAAISSESSTRASADTALASDITTLYSQTASNSSAISVEASTRASVDNGLLAQYTVKTDVNGYVSGYGLANQGPTVGSEFTVIADRFAILANGSAKAVTSITRSGSTATVTCTAHGYSTGNKAAIAGATQSEYNGVFTITVTGANTFTYIVSGTPATPATGTIVARLSNTPFVVGTVDGKTSVIITNAIIGDLTVGDTKIGSVGANKIVTGTVTASMEIGTGGLLWSGSSTFGSAGLQFEGGATRRFHVGDGSTYALRFGNGDGRIYSGKTTFASTTEGFWLGRDNLDANKSKIHFGNASAYLKYESGALYAGSLTAGATGGERITLNFGGDNHFKGYANAGGGLEEIVVIGAKLTGGTYSVGRFGSNTTGNTHYGVVALSYSSTALFAQSVNSYGAVANSLGSSGIGLYASSPYMAAFVDGGDYGGVFQCLSTGKAPVVIGSSSSAAEPTHSALRGSHLVTSNGYPYINHNGSTGWRMLGPAVFVNFDGSGANLSNQTINKSYNVSSVYKNGSKDYTINFLTAIPHANYCVAGSATGTTSSDFAVNIHSSSSGGNPSTMTTTAVRIVTSSSLSINSNVVCVTITA